MDISDSQANSFIKYFGGEGEDIGKDVKQTPDGGYALVGTITSLESAKQVVFIKTDEYGNIEWKLFFGEGKDDYGNSFIIDNDGNYVIVGTITLEDDTTDVYLIKVSAQGSVLWEKNYGGYYNQEGNSLVQKDNNDLYIVGTTETNVIANMMLMLFVNSSGDSLSSKTSNYSVANFIYKLNSTDYIIAGISNNYFAIFRTNNIGKISGTKFDYADLNSFAQVVYPTFDGNFIAAGTSNSDIYITKIINSDDLPEDWTSGIYFGGPLQESGNSVKVTDNDEIIIVGSTRSIETGADIYLIKTDSEGNEIFTKTFGGTGNETGEHLEITNDGGFIIIGSSKYEGNSMICLIKTDSEGNLDQ